MNSSGIKRFLPSAASFRATVLAAGVVLTASPAHADAAAVQGTPTVRPSLALERAVFRTEAGDFVVGFYAEIAPASTRQVQTLITNGTYTNADVTYVSAGFLLQIDPAAQAPTGEPLKAEFNKGVAIHRGTVVMARDQGNPDSARASFFVALADLPELDGQYTVIGEVVDGLSAIAALEATPVDAAFHPTSPLHVTRAELLQTPAQRFGLTLAQGRAAAPAPAAGEDAGTAEFSKLLIGSLMALFGMGLAGLALTHWRGPAAARSCLIAMLLIATPALLAYLLPRAAGHSLAAGALLFALLGVIRLLGRFEGNQAA